MKKTICDISTMRKRLLEEVGEIYDDPEAATILDWLFEKIAGVKKTIFVTDPQLLLSPDLVRKMEAAMHLLKDNVPVQYITGKSFFCGLEFRVSMAVMIPRPETEELVSLVIAENKLKAGLRIVDIGTGSGCIGVTLAVKLDQARVLGIDISQAALDIARENAITHQVRVNFRKIDILDEKSWQSLGLFDIIVSNPPYVRESEKALMKRNVLDHEPSLALYVPDEDPLLFYRAIARFASGHLLPTGNIFLEINENLAKEVMELFIQAGFGNTTIYRDFRGKERMIKATRAVSSQ